MPTATGVSAILGLIALTGMIVLGYGQVDAHQKAVVAADLVALSAAQAHVSGDPDACGIAAIFSDANSAELVDCQLDPMGPDTVGVEVAVRGRHASAVAGPVDAA